jgi:hypothetical protein
MSEVDLSAGILRYEEPVMFLILKENALLTADKLEEIAESASRLSAGKPYLLFSDARANLDISPDGQNAAAGGQLLRLIGANAILVSSWPKKFIANMFIRFNNMPFPMKLFTSAGKALSWLEMQKKML